MHNLSSDTISIFKSFWIIKFMRVYIYLLLALLITPFSLADISTAGISEQVYSFGESVLLTSIVSVNQTGNFNFRSNLVCEDNRTMIFSYQEYMVSGEVYVFARQFSMPSFNSDVCWMRTALYRGNYPLVESQSPHFSISDELESNLTLNTDFFNLGEVLNVSGTITKRNSKPLEGTATLYIDRPTQNHVLKSVEVIDGYFEFIEVISLPPGSYSVAIKAFDDLGNKGVFDVGGIVSSNTLDFDFVLDSNISIYPNQEIIFRGSISKESKQIIQGLSVTIDFNGQILRPELKDDSFYYSWVTPNRSSSGTKNLVVSAQDDFGNHAEYVYALYLEAVPTSLDLRLDSDLVYPGEQLVFQALLYDQADAPLDETVDMSIINDKGVLITNFLAIANGELMYDIKSSMPPADYILKVEHSGLESSSSFSVPPLKKFDVILKDSSVVVENVGNINVKDKITIRFMGNKEYTIKEGVSLNVGDPLSIPYPSNIRTDNYNISIIINDQEFTFIDSVENPNAARISFTGAVTGVLGGASKVVLVIALIILAYALYNHFSMKKRFKKGLRRREIDGMIQGIVKKQKYEPPKKKQPQPIPEEKKVVESRPKPKPKPSPKPKKPIIDRQKDINDMLGERFN